MKSQINKFAQRAVKVAKSSPTLRRIAYNTFNASHFSNLFEHEQLLADAGRCDMYAAAIAKQIPPGSRVVDVGTGTGLLAMLAARIEGTHVYAIDHSDFIEMAEKVARSNGFENITFVKTNSQNFELDEKVDVILHEQIGDDLFEENMVHNLLDLKRLLLKPDGLILPGRFQLFVEPIEVQPDYHTPFINELNIHGLDFSVLEKASADGTFIPDDYKLRYLSAPGFQTALTRSTPVLDVDLNQIMNTDEVPSQLTLQREFTSDGQMAGFGMWFNIVFDETMTLSTSPFDRHTHWAHRLYRTPTQHVKKGEKIDYVLTMPDLRDAVTWKIDIQST